ncbi:MAG: biosynthetic arginine decarboxylase, partial [Hafnia alvei]|nr:biosynthetic arginine decarboxylase [Hafnia alvei]
TRSQSDCSVNYGLNEYANNVIWGIGDACNEHGLPHPTVITESGRAVTAHHTVLVSNVIGVERNEFHAPVAPAEDAPRALQSLWSTWEEMQDSDTKRSLREWLHDSQLDLNDVHSQYAHGILDLTQRAWAEQQYLTICSQIQEHLDPSNRAHRPIIDELQERMADKLYVNFSLFQSMPDAWGIDQLFPVLPLSGLDQAPERRAVLLDITCDSDGAIDHYIDGDGIATTMPMPQYDPENPPLIGFFMVGAYQEILGNMHNLFGDTASVDVFVFEDGSVEVQDSDEGNTVAEMLEYVQLDPEVLLTRFRDQVRKTDLDAELQTQFLDEFESGLYGYTYLEDE